MATEIIRNVRGTDVRLIVESDQADTGTTGGRSGRGRNNYGLWRADTYETREPDTLDWLQQHLRDGDALFDVGANIGQYSLFASLSMGGGIEVSAFEPESLSFAQLNRNIVANGLNESVTAYPLALGDRTGPTELYLRAFLPGSRSGSSMAQRVCSATRSFGAC